MIDRVKLVGILNLTPDSFSGDGIYEDPELAYKRTLEMFDEGANIVDIGAEATNPSSEPITAKEEWQRLRPIVERVLPKFNDRISIDTRHHETVERAAAYGRFLVNDITTFQDSAMIDIAAKLGLRCIASHLPIAAEGDVQYAHDHLFMDNLYHVRDELVRQRKLMRLGGISIENIILDPGIGFGKDMPRNWEALDFARYLPRHKIMIGYSHKSFLATDPETGRPNPGIDRHSIPVNLAAARIVVKSARENNNLLFLRVHDVKAHCDLLDSMEPLPRRSSAHRRRRATALQG